MIWGAILKGASKIAGPRVLIGVIIAALAAVGTLFWLYADARADAGALDEKLAQAERRAENNAAEAKRLASEIERRDILAAKHREQMDALEERFTDTRRRLQQAGEADSGDYGRCRDARLPDGVIAGLRSGAADTDSQD